jgi:hypothetical protein
MLISLLRRFGGFKAGLSGDDAAAAQLITDSPPLQEDLGPTKFVTKALGGRQV